MLRPEIPLSTPHSADVSDFIQCLEGRGKLTIYVRNVKGAGKSPRGGVSPVPMSCALSLVGRGHGCRVRSGRSVRPRASPVAGLSRLDTSVISSVPFGLGLLAFGHFYHAKTSGQRLLLKQEIVAVFKGSFMVQKQMCKFLF